MQIYVDTSNLEKALDAIGRDATAADLDVLGEIVSTAVDDVIQSQGNGQWPWLSATTLKLHPKRRGGKLLQDRGHLANLQTSRGPGYVKVRSPAPYAGFHITGTKQKNIYRANAPHTMPVRDFMDIDFESALDELADTILREIIS